MGVLAVIVLYHRGSREEGYTNLIYVWGQDDSWAGATVTVTGKNLPEGGFVDELTLKNHLSCRIHVPAGTFEVLVKKMDISLARAEQSGRFVDRKFLDLVAFPRAAFGDSVEFEMNDSAPSGGALSADGAHRQALWHDRGAGGCFAERAGGRSASRW